LGYAGCTLSQYQDTSHCTSVHVQSLPTSRYALPTEPIAISSDGGGKTHAVFQPLIQCCFSMAIRVLV